MKRRCTGTPSITGCDKLKDEDEFLNYITVCIDCDLKYRREKYAVEKAQGISNKTLSNFMNCRW